MEDLILKTFIVDDEEAACKQMNKMIQKFPSMEVVGNAVSVDEALPEIVKHRPNVVFLDVEMPGKNGFQLLEELHRLKLYPQIVFTTAFDKYSLQAIRCAAFDYLLKPIDPDELSQTINKLVLNNMDKSNNTKIDLLLQQLQNNRRIKFNTRSGFLMIAPSDIICVEADWNYARIVLKDKKRELVTINIGAVEKMLPCMGFARISRSIIINLSYLEMVDRKKLTCFMKVDGEELQFKISKSRIKALQNILE
jgi:two-component system, LytTR family, response regulator